MRDVNIYLQAAATRSLSLPMAPCGRGGKESMAAWVTVRSEGDNEGF